MKFLVIGGSGFIGGHLLAYAESQGYATCGTQASSNILGLVKFDLLKDRIQDCVEPNYWEQDQPIFAVVCASISQIDECASNRETSYRVNVTNTVRLLQDLTILGVKIIYVSSSFVFDGETGNYREDSPHNPISAYGRDKSEVEEYIRDNMPDALVVRLDKNLSDDPRDGQMLSEWHQSMNAGEPLVCIDGQVFSTTSVQDVAKGIVLASENGLSGVYHLTNSQTCSRMELARRFSEYLGKKANIVAKTQEQLGFLDLRPLLSSLDSTRFVRATGIRFTDVDSVFREFKRKLPIGARQ